MKNQLLLGCAIVGLALSANADLKKVSNLLYHEVSKVTIKVSKNGHSVDLKDILVNSPLRAKAKPHNCSEKQKNMLRQAVGTVFIGSPSLDVLPLTYTFDYDTWTTNCQNEGEKFFLATKQPSPDDIRAQGLTVNGFYERIHKINPIKAITLPELKDLLTKNTSVTYECRLYNLKNDNDGVFYGCTTKSLTAENDRFAESKLNISVNIIEGQPLNVAKRFPKMNANADGKIETVSLYANRAEASGVVEPSVKVETISHGEFLKRAILIDTPNGVEDFILTDK